METKEKQRLMIGTNYNLFLRSESRQLKNFYMCVWNHLQIE